MAREHDDRMMDAPLDRGMDPQDRPAMGTADLLAAAEGRQEEKRAVQAMQHGDLDRQAAGGRTDRAVMQQVETRPAGEPAGQPAQPAQAPQGAAALAALFEPGAANTFRERWREVQVGFVDDPRQAVAHADELVAQVMKSLAESFARQRSRIEAEVGQGDAQASTENLRVALTRYRSFFERLLTL